MLHDARSRQLHAPAESPSYCFDDAQCADAGLNARCTGTNGGPPTCQCTYDACMHDSDCATDETCACHGAPYVRSYGNACAPGNCRVDSDCGPGGYCSPTHGSQNCGGLSGYYCHTPADQCVDDSDCSDGGGAAYCAYSAATNRWQCELPSRCW